MEDLAAAVQSILNDPQSMAQLQGVMNSLGMNPPQAPAPASPPVQQDVYKRQHPVRLAQRTKRPCNQSSAVLRSFF